MRISKRILAVTTLFGLSAAGLAADSIDHRVTVRQVMTSAITPATNTLWGADESPDDAGWQALSDAAVVVMATGALIKSGGTGKDDNRWAAESAWQDYADVMINAAADALAAVEARDIDALMTATDVMYPPCEECHAQYHPEMQ